MARKLMCCAVLLGLTALPLLVHAQAQPNAAQVYEIGKACYGRVKTDAAARKDAGRWDECITIFANLAQSRPGSNEGANASYSAARLSKEKYGHVGGKNNLENALVYYNRVAIDNPTSNLADDALLQIAVIRLHQLKQPDRARKALTALVERYPNGDNVGAARAMLADMNGTARDTEETAPKEEASPESARRDSKSVSTAVVEGDATVDAGGSELASATQPGLLVGVRHMPREHGMAVVLEFDRPADYRAVYDLSRNGGDAHGELEVILKEVHVHRDLVREIDLESSTVQSIDVGRRPLGGTRVLIRLKPGTDYDVTHHRAALEMVFRAPSDPDVFAPRQGSVSKPQAASTGAASGEESGGGVKGFFRKLAFWRKKDAGGPRPLRIVIDPGHGGDEKGAEGPHGIMEKDVVLSIAEKLASQLKRKLGADVWLTRDDDKDVSLKKRQRVAQRKKADLFISVHANASSDAGNGGVETYYLNNATDEAAKKLALRENESWSESRSDIDRILATMLQNAVTEESRDLADDVQTSLVKNLSGHYKGVRDRSVRSALFYVLVGTSCPSILVETSFITNPREEMRLVDPTYQELIASAIADGVQAYTGQQSTAASSL